MENILTVAGVAQLVGGQVEGDQDIRIKGCAGLQEAAEGDLTFVVSAKYETLARQSRASVVILPRQMDLPGKTVIRVDNPSLAFTKVLNSLLASKPSRHPRGIHPTAVIAQGVRLGDDVAIGPYVVIEAGVQIGHKTVIYAHCTIGHNVKIGEHCVLYPHVSVREDVVIANRVVIHNGSVIGSDGFGYVTASGKHEKIPQIGTVVIEDDVEIGANVTIDRARFDKTVIGEGTKIDNLVQIAHNVIIGKHCLIVSQVGISGSTKLGNYVVLAGQAGIAGHLHIGDGAVVAGQSGVSKNIKAGDTVFGAPAQNIKEAFKVNAHVQRLEQYVATIKDLKKRIEELEKKN